MKTIVLYLECLTNLHVGNGDVNYNIIDNEVERDPITQYPTINASGVKGALRNYLKNNENVNSWFGVEGNEGNGGELKILAANMIAMPVRASKGEAAYYLLSTKAMQDEYEKMVSAFPFVNIIRENETKNDSKNEMKAENISLDKSFNILGKTVYIVEDNKFRTLSLPVIARNKLEEGISKNLWYEEVVPHESIFFIPVVSDNEKLLDDFSKEIDGKVVQFGGNASIGYGLCKITIR